MAFYSPPASDRMETIEREWRKTEFMRLKTKPTLALQGRRDGYQAEGAKPIQRLNVEIGKHGGASLRSSIRPHSMGRNISVRLLKRFR